MAYMSLQLYTGWPTCLCNSIRDGLHVFAILYGMAYRVAETSILHYIEIRYYVRRWIRHRNEIWYYVRHYIEIWHYIYQALCIEDYWSEMRHCIRHSMYS